MVILSWINLNTSIQRGIENFIVSFKIINSILIRFKIINAYLQCLQCNYLRSFRIYLSRSDIYAN